jgi:hypothetical protein
MSTIRNKELLREKVNKSKAVLDEKITQLLCKQWISTETIKLAFSENHYVIPETMLNSLELYVKVKNPKVAVRTIKYHLGELDSSTFIKSAFKYRIKAIIINLLNKW